MKKNVVVLSSVFFLALSIGSVRSALADDVPKGKPEAKAEKPKKLSKEEWQQVFSKPLTIALTGSDQTNMVLLKSEKDPSSGTMIVSLYSCPYVITKIQDCTRQGQPWDKIPTSLLLQKTTFWSYMHTLGKSVLLGAGGVYGSTLATVPIVPLSLSAGVVGGVVAGAAPDLKTKPLGQARMRQVSKQIRTEIASQVDLNNSSGTWIVAPRPANASSDILAALNAIFGDFAASKSVAAESQKDPAYRDYLNKLKLATSGTAVTTSPAGDGR